ncbi:MAG: CDP-alcohol phosphatidyltransferase family protein [Firmicutes bacterium]|nr:CDP-alcohol phosphatidyltransferase family protein [Bacillota bacterium]
MANCITSARIVLSLAMFFTETFSGMFYAVYIAAGLTDMIDGSVARKTGTESEAGAKFDTVADFVFVAVSMIRILPCIDLPLWIWIWTGAAALIKIINAVSCFLICRSLPACHSKLNRAAGLLLFLLPLSLGLIDIRFTGSLVCAVATSAALQEGYLIRTAGKNSNNINIM